MVDREKECKEKRMYPLNAVRLCIDQSNEDLSGRIYSRLSSSALKFDNLGEFFLKTDELFENCGYPQAFSEKRYFGSGKSSGHYAPPEALLSTEEVLQNAGKEATVDILVRSRRCAGWQGCLFWMDQRGVLEYHSEMELLYLIISMSGHLCPEKEARKKEDVGYERQDIAKEG